MIRKGWIYVFVQFFCILFLLKHIQLKLVGWDAFFYFTGLFIGAWALYSVRHSRVNILPELRDGAILIEHGPYRMVRHPMYSSLLIFFLPTLLISYFTFCVYLLLLIVLVLKLNYEEKLLLERFKTYENYMKNSYRIIPFIY